MGFSVVDPADVDGLLTSREAGRLIGRSLDAVRMAIHSGALPAVKTWDGWRLKADDVEAWAAATPSRPVPRRRYEDAAKVLDEFGSINADELSKILGVVPGNARKALAVLGAMGRAHRDEQGQWYPGPAGPTDEDHLTGSSEASHRKTA